MATVLTQIFFQEKSKGELRAYISNIKGETSVIITDTDIIATENTLTLGIPIDEWKQIVNFIQEEINK